MTTQVTENMRIGGDMGSVKNSTAELPGEIIAEENKRIREHVSYRFFVQRIPGKTVIKVEIPKKREEWENQKKALEVLGYTPLDEELCKAYGLTNKSPHEYVFYVISNKVLIAEHTIVA